MGAAAEATDPAARFAGNPPARNDRPNTTMTRTTIARFAAVVLLAAGTGVWSPAGQAACAPPTLRLSDASVPAGSKITITGRFWTTRCDDTGGGQVGGCDDSDEPKPKKAPGVRGISVRVKRVSPGADVSRVIATDISARPGGRLKAKVLVPADLPAGRYEVTAFKGGIRDYNRRMLRVTRG
jgi:hypothetical protein